MKRRIPWKLVWSIVGASGILGFIGRSIWEWATTDARLFNWVTILFRGFVSIRVPLWAAILFVGAAVLVLIAIVRIMDAIDEPSPPEWWNKFTSMPYRKWKFKWKYGYTLDDKIAVRELRSVCVTCGCDLKVSYHGPVYCPNCDVKNEPLEPNALRDAESVIRHKVENWGKEQ